MLPDQLSEFIEEISPVICVIHVAAAVANVAAMAVALRARRFVAASLWLAWAVGFASVGWGAFSGSPAGIPPRFKVAIDAGLGPVTLTLGSMCALVATLLGRRFFVRPIVAWGLLNLAILFLGLSLADIHFARLVLLPDNLPIVGMVFLLGFFLWLGGSQAVTNDARLRAGGVVLEKDDDGSVLVWPDLVYIELICMVLLMTGLIVWSILLRAPLEPPANPAVTPNPAKAPWYFLGLQEMLVYFDPSFAGVILPCLIVFGLAAIPYLDRNPKGSGHYSLNLRPAEISVFLFGFLQLWIVMIIIGTFFRGAGWGFFGPYESHESYPGMVATNVRLCEYFWTGLGLEVPQASPTSVGLRRLCECLWRELPGVIVLLGYLVAVPIVLARTKLKGLRSELGRVRYGITLFLLLMMLAVPIKMLLRWTCSLSYLVSLPEYFFNF